MKLPSKFTIHDSRFTIESKSSESSAVVRSACASANRKSQIVNRKSTSGIALVITLILLSVTLVMALAFLAISRRESSSVTTAGETTTARAATESGLANAEAQIMANIFATKNPYSFGLIVSTNSDTGNTLPQLAGLLYAPRAPVLVSPAEPQGRFYLDLNRNGFFDANGLVAETNSAGLPTGATNFYWGDPEWIGVLERPDAPHGPNNKFIGRYVVYALPVGNSLDLNAIHNQVFNRNLTTADGFFRNQGVGSWEINLPAFLADLNTNEWDLTAAPYTYNEPVNNNSGTAFDDARSLLAFRYAGNYNTLASVQNLYGLAGATAFQNDIVDGYTDGGWMTNTLLSYENDAANLPWAGANNTNHFFTPSDFFDTAKTQNGLPPLALGFTDHLLHAGTNNSTHDRYTFYRLLSQLGTDSSSESGKLNLNYVNVDASGNIVPGMETNFIPWTPLQFFTNAADRMLRTYTANWINQNFGSFTNTFGASTTNAFGLANIPVYVDGRFVYTPAVQRVLQLAANIYDSTVNNSANGSPDYPDVFRPLFSRDVNGTGTNIYITGYTNIVSFTDGASDIQLLTPVDVTTFSHSPGIIINLAYNIYGVPWIVGAKKGFPNFNEFSMENNLAVTRRLQVTRLNNATPVKGATITGTNQMYTMSLTNSLGIELWNSYAASYPGTILIGVNENATLMITNDDHGTHQWILQPFSTNALFSITSWQGAGAAPWYGGNPNSRSFITVNFNGPMLTNSVYRSSYSTAPYGSTGVGFVATHLFDPTTGTPLLFEQSSPNGFYFPQFGVLMTNRLQVFMLDFTNGVYHVIDYVHFDGPDSAFNVNASLADIDTPPNIHPGVWNTNYTPGSSGSPTDPTYGIINQISISKNGAPDQEDGLWQADPEAVPLGGKTADQQKFFRAFFLPGNHEGTTTNLQLSVQAPYTPTRYIVQYSTWQANDPLVHYLASDINTPSPNTISTPKQGLNHYSASDLTLSALTSLNLGSLNDRYMPWGGQPKFTTSDPNPYNTALKDPLVSSSDNWDFPTGKLPTTGWLGRVHRGTPWQTAYLKSGDILTNASAWATWTGNGNSFDAANAAPVQDRLLFDLFTTAFNGNATRGQLSVNQSGLAAWSALLGGVVALENNPSTGILTATNIQPAGVYDPAFPPPLAQIWQGINTTRANLVNANGLNGTFEHTGDILRTPQLTEQSPFISIIPGVVDPNGVWSPPPVYPSDEVMEWLPQQVMSLLRVGTPRYVIYSYGQTLKPAPGGIVMSGNFFGLVTNYQVVSEIATRSVVRFDSTVTNILGINSVINNRAVIESFNILPPE